MRKPWTERVGDFVAGKGFYIVLFLCVAAIGISGYYLFSTLGSDGGDSVTVDAPAQVVITPAPPASSPPAVTAPQVSPTPAPTPKPSPSPSPAPAPSPSASPAPSEPASSPVFTWPVKGDVIHDFSLETLAYDETMGDWRTHCGIDIAASLGAEVLAISSGTVEAIYQDDLMGTTVVVDHGDGLKSYYANLASVPAVSEGEEVTTGAIIGSVGNTALAESARATHLHLEITKDGLTVDPINYLPEQS